MQALRDVSEGGSRMPELAHIGPLKRGCIKLCADVLCSTNTLSPNELSRMGTPEAHLTNACCNFGAGIR